MCFVYFVVIMMRSRFWLEGKDEAAAVGEIEADARVWGEVGDGFADDAIGLRRWCIFRMGIARHFARIREGAAVRRQKKPHVLEADSERSGGSCQAADCWRVTIKSDGKYEEVVWQTTEGS